MKRKIKAWAIVTVIIALVAIGLVVASMFFEPKKLLIAGLATMVVSQLTLLRTRALMKKDLENR